MNPFSVHSVWNLLNRLTRVVFDSVLQGRAGRQVCRAACFVPLGCGRTDGVERAGATAMLLDERAERVLELVAFMHMHCIHAHAA